MQHTKPATDTESSYFGFSILSSASALIKEATTGWTTTSAPPPPKRTRTLSSDKKTDLQSAHQKRSRVNINIGVSETSAARYASSQQRESNFEIFRKMLEDECYNAGANAEVFEKINRSLNEKQLEGLRKHFGVFIRHDERHSEDSVDPDKIMRQEIKLLFGPIIQETWEQYLREKAPTGINSKRVSVSRLTGRHHKNTPEVKIDRPRNTVQYLDTTPLRCTLIETTRRNPEVPKKGQWEGHDEAKQILASMITTHLQQPNLREQYEDCARNDILRLDLVLVKGFFAGSSVSSFQEPPRDENRLLTTIEFIKNHLPDNLSEDKHEVTCATVWSTINQRILGFISRGEIAETFPEDKYALLPSTSLDSDESELRYTLYCGEEKGKFTLNISITNNNTRSSVISGRYNRLPYLGLVIPSGPENLRTELEIEINIDVSREDMVKTQCTLLKGNWESKFTA